jgi:hypothetical protein
MASSSPLNIDLESVKDVRLAGRFIVIRGAMTLPPVAHMHACRLHMSLDEARELVRQLDMEIKRAMRAEA